MAGHRSRFTGRIDLPLSNIGNTRLGKELLTLKDHKFPVHLVAFAPDGRLLASASSPTEDSVAGGEIILWDLASRKIDMKITGHAQGAESLAISPDNRLVVSGSRHDRTVRVWNVAGGEELHRWEPVAGPIAFSPDGGEIVTGAAVAAERVEDGFRVVLDDGSATAEVVRIRGNDAEIAFGSMRVRTKLDRLTRVGGPRAQKVVPGGTTAGTGGLPALDAKTSIDVRGKRADEAVREVARLIDDAVSAGLERVARDVLGRRCAG
jgi:hypothetical protein